MSPTLLNPEVTTRASPNTPHGVPVVRQQSTGGLSAILPHGAWCCCLRMALWLAFVGALNGPVSHICQTTAFFPAEAGTRCQAYQTTVRYSGMFANSFTARPASATRYSGGDTCCCLVLHACCLRDAGSSSAPRGTFLSLYYIDCRGALLRWDEEAEC